MLTRLFNQDEAEAYQVVEGASEITYGHTFGGEGGHEGTIPQGWPKPVHLFYDLDLSD